MLLILKIGLYLFGLKYEVSNIESQCIDIFNFEKQKTEAITTCRQIFLSYVSKSFFAWGVFFIAKSIHY